MAKPFGKPTSVASPFGWLAKGRDSARRWSGRGFWPFAAQRPPTAPASGYRKALFEPLEPRLLLSADPFTYAATAASEIALRLDDTTNYFQVIDKADNDAVLDEKALSATSEIVISGSAAADKFTIDLSTPFAVSVSFDGGGGDDTLEVTGLGDTVDWLLTGTDAGTVTGAGGFNASFSDVDNLLGSADTDNFDLGVGNLTGSIDGGGGTDSLKGGDGANTWTLTATDAGTVTNVGGGFSNIENLTGGTAADEFVLSGGTLSGAIDGGGGSNTLTGDDVASSWSVTRTDAGTVTGVGGGFSNIENLTGGTAADEFALSGGTLSGAVDGGGGWDTLTGDDVATSWSVTGTDAGTVTGVGGGFSNIENLTGGTAADEFALSGGTLSGAVDGGGGSDTLTGDDVVSSWFVTGTDAGTATGVGGGFSNIENLTGGTAADEFALSGGTLSGAIVGSGGGADTLTGDNVANTWLLNSSNAGTVTGVGGGFSGIESLTGGADTDSFDLGTGSLQGAVAGGGGVDTLAGGSGGRTWVLTGSDAGTAVGVGGGFSAIENLTGGAAADSFVLAGGTLSGAIGDTGGSDTLTGDDVDNSWVLTATNTGVVTGVAGGFTDIENLTGGTEVDTFDFGVGSIQGNLTGGLGQDVLNYADRTTSVAVDLGLGSATGVGLSVGGVEDVIGGGAADSLSGDSGDNRLTGGGGADVISGGGGTDTLVETRDADFTLTATTLEIGSDGADTLSGIEAVELTGGAGANVMDTTAFAGDVTLDAGAGDDTLKVSGVGGPTVDGGADTDTLVVLGTAGADVFTISDTAVTLDGDTIDLTAASIESLEVLGGGDDDVFNVTPSATLPIHIDGEGGADTLNIEAGGNDVVVRQGFVKVVGTQPVTYTSAETETVVLLNRGEIINELDRAIVEAGLAALEDLGEEIEDTDALAAILPGLADNTVTQVGSGLPPVTGGDVSLGRAMGIGEVLSRLREEVSAFFDSTPSPTLKELKAHLDGLTVADIPAEAPAEAGDLALGDLTISIGSVTETLIENENENDAPVIGLAFTLVATRRTRFDVDYGADADSLGVVLDPADARDLVELETEMALELGIGLEGANTDELFFELDGLTVEGSARERDLSFDVDFGFLGGSVAPVENLSVSGSGPFSITFEGALGGQDVAELVVDAGNLTGGNATIATATGGAAGTDEIQELTVVQTGYIPDSLDLIHR